MADAVTVSSIFTSEALDLLELRLHESENSNEFLLEADSIASQTRYLIDLPTAIEFTQPLQFGQEGSNASILFEAIGAIDRSNAADPRLWSYLSMIAAREYMSKRWPLETASNLSNYANDHWLMTTPSSRKMMRNGVGRLWWIANLTYDPEFSHPLSASTGDPFAYTKWVLENENRRQAIFERQLGRSPRLRWAVMEAMQELQESGKKDNSKALLKKVYLHSGYQRLETLPDHRLKEVISNLLREVL